MASRVTIDPRADSQHTVIEVITRDRPDLLFWLSSAIHEAGCFIDLAKINTEGDRVADVFYVTNEDGSKVTDQAKLAHLEAAIRATLTRLEGRSGS